MCDSPWGERWPYTIDRTSDNSLAVSISSTLPSGWILMTTMPPRVQSPPWTMRRRPGQGYPRPALRPWGQGQPASITLTWRRQGPVAPWPSPGRRPDERAWSPWAESHGSPSMTRPRTLPWPPAPLPSWAPPPPQVIEADGEADVAAASWVMTWDPKQCSPFCEYLLFFSFFFFSFFFLFSF